MNLRRISLRVDCDDVETASALLGASAGVPVAVEHRERSTAPRPIISAYVSLADARRAPRALEKSLAIAKAEGLLRSARRSIATVRGQAWGSAWKRHFRPSKIASGLYLAPSWRKDFKPPLRARVITMDPGMAFGTGQHATTKMALRLLLPYVRAREPMLDIGCGSGILGIAAAQLGARVYACDVDSIAVEASRENFARNGLRPAALKRFSGVPGVFPATPLIAANITADVLALLAADFFDKLALGGSLVTSGVTKRGRRAVLDAFARAGLRLVRERKSGEWLAHVHAKDTL